MQQRKQIRRRRAVLGALVGIALVLLTGYFREGAGGALHGVQTGVLTVISPIEQGASKALKPARDAFGWVGSTLHAKSQVQQLQTQNARLVHDASSAQVLARQNAQLRGLVRLDRRGDLSTYQPVTARIIQRDPTVWYETITVNAGSGDGIRVDQPVVDGTGLVGRVSTVTPFSSVITLITDHTSGVDAKVARTGDPGAVVPSTGDPNDLVMQYLPQRSRVRPGDRIVTSGTRAGRLDSLFPPDIPIGVVTRVSPDELQISQQVHLAPYADLRRDDYVQILTRSGGADPSKAAHAQVGP